MNIQDIQLIYNYNYWANGKILEASQKVTEEQFLAPASFPFGGLRGTLVHTLDAERGWLRLFEKKPFGADLNLDDFPTVKSIDERWREEEKAMRAYLANLKDEDMESHLHYTADSGAKRDRILWHCLLHVANHGTQHRSEAAALLTDFGASPGDLDFTVFLNETGKS
ncbi:MAG: hypothetical protein HOP27_10665 [Anaerolineales bacterium]|nr:hypothetical protein [Anaerolineales bacterium]